MIDKRRNFHGLSKFVSPRKGTVEIRARVYRVARVTARSVRAAGSLTWPESLDDQLRAAFTTIFIHIQAIERVERLKRCCQPFRYINIEGDALDFGAVGIDC